MQIHCALRKLEDRVHILVPLHAVRIKFNVALIIFIPKMPSRTCNKNKKVKIKPSGVKVILFVAGMVGQLGIRMKNDCPI